MRATRRCRGAAGALPCRKVAAPPCGKRTTTEVFRGGSMRRNHRYGSMCVRVCAQVMAAALACGGAASWADQQPAQPAEEATPTVGLQEVVVTATRREQSLSKVPISVTALTQESLDERGIKA